MTKSLKKSIIALVVIICVIMAAVFSAIIHFASGGTRELFALNPYEKIHDESYSTTEISDIVINSDAGDIKVLNSKNDDIRLVANGRNNDAFAVECKNGVLTVTSNAVKEETEKGIQHYGADIDLYIPESIASLTINSSLGDIKIKGKINASLTAENICGDFSASYLEGSFDIKTDLGDIDITRIDISDNSTVTTDMGDIEVNFINDISVSAETSLGSCKVNGGNPNADISLTAKSNLGDIKIN